MKNKISIRKANIKDLDYILKLNFALFKNEYRNFDKSIDLDWTHSDKGKRYFEDRITKKMVL